MTAKNEMLHALEQEAQGLLRELRQNPAFKRYEAIRLVIELYGGTIPPALSELTHDAGGPKAIAPETGGRSQTALVAAEAEKYFKEVRRRTTSGPLVAALKKRGVEVPGKNPGAQSARLASILAGRRRIFDNVKGQGYGLVEWGDKATSTGTPEPEAPDPARSSAPASNGMLPIGH